MQNNFFVSSQFSNSPSQRSRQIPGVVGKRKFPEGTNRQLEALEKQIHTENGQIDVREPSEPRAVQTCWRKRMAQMRSSMQEGEILYEAESLQKLAKKSPDSVKVILGNLSPGSECFQFGNASKKLKEIAAPLHPQNEAAIARQINGVSSFADFERMAQLITYYGNTDSRPLQKLMERGIFFENASDRMKVNNYILANLSHMPERNHIFSPGDFSNTEKFKLSMECIHRLAPQFCVKQLGKLSLCLAFGDNERKNRLAQELFAKIQELPSPLQSEPLAKLLDRTKRYISNESTNNLLVPAMEKALHRLSRADPPGA